MRNRLSVGDGDEASHQKDVVFPYISVVLVHIRTGMQSVAQLLHLRPHGRWHVDVAAGIVQSGKQIGEMKTLSQFVAHFLQEAVEPTTAIAAP